MSDPTMVELGEDFPELREAVRRICADFPGEYWRKLEEAEAYPTEFIAKHRGAPEDDVGRTKAISPESSP